MAVMAGTFFAEFAPSLREFGGIRYLFPLAGATEG
jgi:hypothetical protein